MVVAASIVYVRKASGRWCAHCTVCTNHRCGQWGWDGTLRWAILHARNHTGREVQKAHRDFYYLARHYHRYHRPQDPPVVIRYATLWSTA